MYDDKQISFSYVFICSLFSGDLQLTVSVASVECLGLLEKCANSASAAATIWSGQGHADKRAQMLYKYVTIQARL